ncbi:MAG: EAL domain-containing protein [Pseudomonadaceae bacterium]|nr:EAL domain-containing protein [Pseudomonadaceae bacterium]
MFAAGVLFAALLLAVCLAANQLASELVSNRLRNLSLEGNATLQVLGGQVSKTLQGLNALELPAQCTPELFGRIATLVKEQRYIYESAVRLSSGAVCSSYGQAFASTKLPAKEDAGYYPAGDGRSYWFQTGREVSADAGALVIGQFSAYLWLNKGILLDVLRMPAEVSFNLVDEQSLQSRFSSDNRLLKIERRLEPGQVEFTNGMIHLATPVKWVGLVGVLTLPYSAYREAWWWSFAGLLGASIVLLLGLYCGASYLYARHFSLPAKLRCALQNNQLSLHYQPIVNMHNGQWKGAEALLRWRVKGQPISPEVFIPAAENSGMIAELTRWVCQRVAEDYAEYLWACKDFYITINLSATDVTDASFPDFVEALFKRYDISPVQIVFEVTEGALLDKEQAIIQLQRLRDQGHKIAIDDFGTGYSSLAYLEQLPIDILKIDRSFLTPDKLHSSDGLWWHVVSMARSLNLSVVAEGVEIPQQVDPLILAGVSLAQGWLYSKDLPVDKLAKSYFSCADPALSAAI